MEKTFQEDLAFLKVSEPIKYLEEIVKRTVTDKCKHFLEPPKDVEKSIRMGLCQILNILYCAPDEEISYHVNMTRTIAASVSEQTNLYLDFEEFYRQTVATVVMLSQDTFERRNQFQKSLYSMMNLLDNED